MSTQPTKPVAEILASHSSVRSYVNNELPRETVERLISTAQCAATSSFRQTYSVVWVRDAEKRAKLGTLSCNPGQYATADAAFVICVDFKRLQTAVKMHDAPFVHDCAENLLLGVVDASLFAQNLVVASEAEGLGICYIGGVRTNIAEVSELLNLPDLVFPIFGLTIGVPTEGAVNPTKPRLPVAAVLHEDSYDVAKYDTVLPQYDEQLSAYYAARGAATKNAVEWTKAQIAGFSKLSRPHIKAFLATKGFTFA